MMNTTAKIMLAVLGVGTTVLLVSGRATAAETAPSLPPPRRPPPNRGPGPGPAPGPGPEPGPEPIEPEPGPAPTFRPFANLPVGRVVRLSGTPGDFEIVAANGFDERGAKYDVVLVGSFPFGTRIPIHEDNIASVV